MTWARDIGEDVDEHDPQGAGAERAGGLDVLLFLMDRTWPRTIRATAPKEKKAITPMSSSDARPGRRAPSTRRWRRPGRAWPARRRSAGPGPCPRGAPCSRPASRGRRRRPRPAPAGHDADEQRDPGAVGDAHQDVPAQLVGAQAGSALPGPTGMPSGVSPVKWYCVSGPWPTMVATSGAKIARQRDQHDHDRGDYGHPVVAQAFEGQVPRAAALDGPARYVGARPGGLGHGDSTSSLVVDAHGPVLPRRCPARPAAGGRDRSRALRPYAGAAAASRLLSRRPRGSGRPPRGRRVVELHLERGLLGRATGCALGQRGWKRQPVGGLIGDGTLARDGGARCAVGLVRVGHRDGRLQRARCRGGAGRGVEVLGGRPSRRSGPGT